MVRAANSSGAASGSASGWAARDDVLSFLPVRVRLRQRAVGDSRLADTGVLVNTLVSLDLQLLI